MSKPTAKFLRPPSRGSKSKFPKARFVRKASPYGTKTKGVPTKAPSLTSRSSSGAAAQKSSRAPAQRSNRGGSPAYRTFGTGPNIRPVLELEDQMSQIRQVQGIMEAEVKRLRRMRSAPLVGFAPKRRAQYAKRIVQHSVRTNVFATHSALQSPALHGAYGAIRHPKRAMGAIRAARAAWKEALHPRQPKGTPGGGSFRRK